MRMIYRFLAVVLLGAAAGGGRAQPALPLQVDLDHSVFAYSEQASLLEVYLSFGVTSLPYEPDSAGYRAVLPMRLSAVRSSEAALPGTPGEPVWEETTDLSFVVPDTSVLQAQNYFVHQLRTTLPPGEYELRLHIPADEARGRQQLELRRDILVPDFSGEELVGLSDVTLATAIERSTDRADTFYKNGLIVRPNANQLYGAGLEQLQFYAEAYNVDAIAGDDRTYTVYAYISEVNRPQPVTGLQQRLEREARSPDILLGAFDLGALPTGSYFLRIALLNENNEAAVEQARKFFVYNPDVAREEPVVVEEVFETSPYAAMDEQEVEQNLAYADLVATDGERRRARSIQDLDGRRRFLMEFWKKRDPTPETPVNEFREEFFRRVQYANERYSNSYEEGWQTDRGRTLVKYGPPVGVEPRLYERDARPHEIWEYNNIPGEGQALFIFADRQGFGRFELIHSTVAGEPKLVDWQMELRR